MMPRYSVVLFDNDKSRIAKTTFARRRSQKEADKKTFMAPEMFFGGGQAIHERERERVR
jgi:hypothetical protein